MLKKRGLPLLTSTYVGGSENSDSNVPFLVLAGFFLLAMGCQDAIESSSSYYGLVAWRRVAGTMVVLTPHDPFIEY